MAAQTLSEGRLFTFRASFMSVESELKPRYRCKGVLTPVYHQTKNYTIGPSI